MVTVTAFNGSARLEVDAQRCPEQRLLDVVDGEGVAGQQHIHETAADQIAEVRSAAGVHDDRSGDDGDLFAGRFGFAHHRRNPRHAGLDAALGRDLVGHEREAKPVARLEFRHDLDAANATDDDVAARDLAQFAADGAVLLEHNRRVHALVFHRQPLAAMHDKGLMVGGGVEVFRRTAVAIGRQRLRIFDPRDTTAETDQFLERLRQRRRRFRRDSHRDERWLVVGAADPEFEHFERRIVANHGVEHHVQQLRINQVTFSFDDF